jgi:hypothetical protein
LGWSLAGAFLFGLGLYAKFLFLWFIAALIGAVILLNLSGWIKRRSFRAVKLTPAVMKETLLAGLAFLLGCWPLLLYNWQTGGTWLNISQNAGTSYYGVNNLAFGPNLLERLGQFISLVSGSHLWYLGQVINNPLPALALGLIFIWASGLAWTHRSPTSLAPYFFPAVISPAQAAFLPFLVIGLVITASIGTVSALWVTHFALLMPWPAIALAGAGWQIDQWTDKPGGRLNPSRFILITSLTLLVVTNLINITRYHQALTESGGLSAHSDAIYNLSDWLAQHAGPPVAAMDWGLTAPVVYLTNGQINPTERFGYAWDSDADLTARLRQAIAQPATLYLWRAPDEVIFDRSPQFKALYRPLNLEETIEAVFYEHSGRPLLGVTRLVPQGTAANPPK